MLKIKYFLLLMIFSSFSLAGSICFTKGGAVWIDVRSTEEYLQDNIRGDVRISHDEIASDIVKYFPDKSQTIYLYCRSGRRAGIALESLKAAGYNNVFNKGGINDARKERSIKPLEKS